MLRDGSAIAWLLLLIISQATCVLSQDPQAVAMVYPPRAREKHPKIYFQPGENVTFNWTSSFPWITLELYQGPKPSGQYAMESLLSMPLPTVENCLDRLPSDKKSTTANVSNATHQSYDWIARILPNMSRGIPFHLHLYNAENPMCERCHSKSSLFEIAQPGAEGSDGSSASTAPSSKLPLGLGLGLGLPLLVLVTGFATWACLRWKRKLNGDEGSLTAVPLVDNKGAYREDVKAEMYGQNVIELSSLGHVVEAPSSVNRNRVELEGSEVHAR